MSGSIAVTVGIGLLPFGDSLADYVPFIVALMLFVLLAYKPANRTRL